MSDSSQHSEWHLDQHSPYYDEFSDIESGQWWIRTPNGTVGCSSGDDAQTILSLFEQLGSLQEEHARLRAKLTQSLKDVETSPPVVHSPPTQSGGGEMFSVRLSPSGGEPSAADYQNLVEQFEVLREFFIAHWEVEQGITDFDLHAEAVERLRAAMEPAYRVSFPARTPDE